MIRWSSWLKNFPICSFSASDTGIDTSKSLILVSVKVGTAPPILAEFTCIIIVFVTSIAAKNSAFKLLVRITTTCGFNVASSESPVTKALLPSVEPVFTKRISPL